MKIRGVLTQTKAIIDNGIYDFDADLKMQAMQYNTLQKE